MMLKNNHLIQAVLANNLLSRQLLRFTAKVLPYLNQQELAKNRRILFKGLLTDFSKDREIATYHIRPMYAEDVGTWTDRLKVLPRFALVLQGPVVKENDFSLHSVRIYKRHFPGANIILSTWDDEDDEYLRLIQREDVEIVQSCKPEYSGVQNINLQIVSSLAGIRKGVELGVDFVMKTRTDQRMYAPNVLAFLCNLLDIFPPASGYQQKKRLIGVSMNTFKYRLYGVSDMLLFGGIEDMERYWSCKLDERRIGTTERMESLREFSSQRLCEVYLATEFLTSIGRSLSWTLEDSWRVIADHFVIINKEDLDLVWTKYSHEEYRWLRYEGVSTEMELRFREWCNLYYGLSDKASINNAILDLSRNVMISESYS